VVRLSDISKEISERLADSDLEHVINLRETLCSVTLSIRRDPKNPDPRGLDLLKAISDAIVVSFNPEKRPRISPRRSSKWCATSIASANKKNRLQARAFPGYI
jgi:hypothetical protein